MTDPDTKHTTLVDRILHRSSAADRRAHDVRASHPFVSGTGGTHTTGRGSGGWVWLDDSSYDTHVCLVCGHPESDPAHAVESLDEA